MGQYPVASGCNCQNQIPDRMLQEQNVFTVTYLHIASFSYITQKM